MKMNPLVNWSTLSSAFKINQNKQKEAQWNPESSSRVNLSLFQ